MIEMNIFLDCLLDIIEYNFEETNIDLISDDFGISSRHLQRLFKLAFNQSLGSYIRSRKLAASVDDLLNTRLNILNIALDYGFEYEQSYIRSFRREYGITPGDVRKTGKLLKITPPLNLLNSKRYFYYIMLEMEAAVILMCHDTDTAEMINNYFKPVNKKVTVRTVSIPAHRNKPDAVPACGRGSPDVITLESSIVRKYVESGQLLDLTDIYEANKNKLLAYPAEIGAYNGRVYALSWQACSGAMFYRRSLAKKYLGTDDPAAVQGYFGTINKFLETAMLIKDKSGGSCAVVSGFDELYVPFMGARSSPWIVDGRLVIDPVIDAYLNLCGILHNNGLEAGNAQWDKNWVAGQRGEAKNREGKPVEIFSYFLSAWCIPFVLKLNAAKTKGDWALVPGPVSYSWGGTWLGVNKNTNNPDSSKELIRYLTTDDAFLEKYARETGDMVSNTVVINKLMKDFKEPFLGNQNHYAEFARLAQNVKCNLVQRTDLVINKIFFKEVMPCVPGEKSRKQALYDFRAQAEAKLGL
jgi:AraC-like DNA-binding protein/ABC-type glycerol-3-phosphate transport system substrate-binding protein